MRIMARSLRERLRCFSTPVASWLQSQPESGSASAWAAGAPSLGSMALVEGVEGVEGGVGRVWRGPGSHWALTPMYDVSLPVLLMVAVRSATDMVPEWDEGGVK